MIQKLNLIFLEPLVALMEGNKKIGVVSSKLLYYSKPNTIQFAGHNGINFYTGRGFGIGYMEPDFDNTMKIIKQNWHMELL